ncbi:RepB family plasmid replication initiator protein [Allorhizobium borbori]|uniref:Initiator Rep protein WH1 domain-containing protein n=1 Tax=Allorhizobium borbori TaxID=485907 RepID=A0A7W6JZG5_9HYPH|nr:RepB family plasmid replication initiator protein [Allorhizobium borbori]MBB4102370.1 hypothetical protein [Allorhizobium borbori]
MDYQQPTDIDEMGKPRHKMHGKRGTFMEHWNQAGVRSDYIWQLSGNAVIRGYQRRGIKASDFDFETVQTNDRTSPRIEIPRVVVETLKTDIKTLNAQDIAIFWRLFGQHRHHGIEDATATISMQALKDFLGVEHRSRIIKSLQKLTSLQMSIHVNQFGAHGRVSMPMLEMLEIDGEIVTFGMPKVLRDAVGHSRDYGWVDINAIAKFRSKYTTALYIKASFEAGKHWSKRQTIGGSRQQFASALGIPETAQTSVVEDAIARVRDDLLAISGPRRRFKLSFDLGFGPEDDILIEVGNAAKKLKEVKALNLTAEAREQVDAVNTGVNSIPTERYPNLLVLRKAATWLNSSVQFVADKWKLEVWAAMGGKAEFSVGLSDADFIGLIDQHGADDVLEFWLDKKDFAQFGSFNIAEDVGVAVERQPKKKVVTAVIETNVVEAEYVADDDISMGDDYAHLSYGDEPTPDFKTAAVDYSDDDIDF